VRVINKLVAHCTATLQTATVESLQRYWREKMKWTNPGYHYVILPDGTYRSLQDISKPSNGVAGHNIDSIHISYIGGVDAKGKAIDNRTPAQKETMRRLFTELKAKFPSAKILGHRDFSPDKNGNGKVDYWERVKECPCFDAIPEYANI
jgi:N-acetylmuramoyl-L-alanine amidase